MSDDEGEETRIQNKIQRLANDGYSLEDIMKKLNTEFELEAIEKHEKKLREQGKLAYHDEKILQERELLFDNQKFYLYVSQTFQYREPNKENIKEKKKIYQLLRDAYRTEILGPESFRSGLSLTLEEFDQVYNDPDYHWLLAITPNGYEVVDNDEIIAVCCYTRDGIMRINGKEQVGKLISIRYLASLSFLRYPHGAKQIENWVNKRYGYRCGTRLLKKIIDNIILENSSFPSNSNDRHDWVNLPIVSTRDSLFAWAGNEGFEPISAFPYPKSLNHKLKENLNEEVLLVNCVTQLSKDKELEKKELELIKNKKIIEEKLKNNKDYDDDFDEIERSKQNNIYVEGKMHLPPAWRYAGNSSSNTSTTSSSKIKSTTNKLTLSAMNDDYYTSMD